MLAIKQLKLLWNGRINLDEQIELLKDTDEVDNYLIKLMQRFRD